MATERSSFKDSGDSHVTISLLVLTIIACCSHTTLALVCYNCNSTDLLPNPKCIGPDVSSTYSVECTQGEKYCMVQTTTATVLNHPVIHTTRLCSDLFLHRCIYRGVVKTCFDSCTEDLCNSATSQAKYSSPSRILLTAALCLLIQELL